MSPRDIAIAVETTMGSDCLADDPEAFTLERGPAPAVATPGSIDELSELMKLAASHRWAVLPAGQGTWLTAGFPPRRIDLVVSTRRLTGPLVHRPDDLLATVAAGARLADLNAELADERQWWPLDPLGQGSVGAAIATGCAGPLAALYGAPRDLVLGLTVVLTDGRVVKAGGRVVKNVAGYDMVKLYTGSWGTLGVIAEAHLRLYALPPADKTRLFSAERPAELTELAAELSTSGRLAPAATEILSPDVARALGLESEGWQLAVRWLGHGRAVADAVGAAEARHGRDRSAAWADGWKKIAGVEAVLDSALTVRVDVPLRATLDVIHAATPFVAGAAPALLGSPSLGRLWVFVPPEVYEEAGVRTWAMRVEELRRDASQSGGSVRVERGSLELRRAVDPWGGLSDALALVEGLKRRFDPDERLKPGFFVGLL